MLQPLRPNPAKQQSSGALAVPPPIGGWNVRDALDLMPAEDAIRLENWFPRTNDVVLRKGHAEHSTTAMGSGSTVKTLVELKAGTVSKMVAASGGKIYDATTATPSELGTGYSEDAWQTTVFKDMLFAVNGTDAPWTYDGSTFDSTSGFTGPTIANLIQVAHHATRLFFVEKDSTSFWYGGLGSITGSLTEFDLNDIAQKGGQLNSIAIIASDGGVSSEDLVCFFMTTGEVIVYQGSNPGDASAWSKVGSFTLAKPIGRRNFITVGADVVCITQDGFIPLTKALPFGRSRDDQTVLSDKIKGAVGEAVRDYKGNVGWQPTLYPLGDMLLFNIPTSTTVFHQYVMNLNTGAWCKFTGWNGWTFAVYEDELYFGGTDGKIYKADTGTSDNTAVIQADGATAWNYFEDRTRLKRFTMARPIFTSDGDLTVSLGLSVDFNEVIPAYSASSSTTGPEWDDSIWDAVLWGGGAEGLVSWFSVANIGYAASLRVRLSTSTLSVTWNSTTYAMEPGGII
jgi:hypothetical protein